MATTIPTEFAGTPTLTEEKVAAIKEWYIIALGDSDKAGDIDDACYYTGLTEAYESVLNLLHNITPTSMPLEDS